MFLRFPHFLLPCICVFLAGIGALRADVINTIPDAERMVRCLKVYAPQGWAPANVKQGSLEIPKRHGKPVEGTVMHFENRQHGEAFDLYLLPRNHPLKKDWFLKEWLRPGREKTVCLWKNDNIEILAHGENTTSWKTWKRDIHDVLRDLGGT